MELLVCLGLGLISSIHRPIDFCLNGSPNISPPSGWHPPTAMHRITCQIHNFQIERDNSYNMNIFAQSLNSLHQIHPDTPNPLEQSWYFCNLLSWTIHHLQKSPYGQKSVFFSKAWFSVVKRSLICLASLQHRTLLSHWLFEEKLNFLFSSVIFFHRCHLKRLFSLNFVKRDIFHSPNSWKKLIFYRFPLAGFAAEIPLLATIGSSFAPLFASTSRCPPGTRSPSPPLASRAPFQRWTRNILESI